MYENPLNKTAITGAIRVLKKMAVSALDPDLAKLVKSIEAHFKGSQP